MLGRWLTRLTTKHILTSGRMWLPSKKRGGRSIPEGLKGEEATPEQVQEINQQQRHEQRETKMHSVKARTLRQPEQQLERKITRLMDEGKSDQQIIQMLSQQQPKDHKKTGKTRAELQQEKEMEKMLGQQFQQFAKMTAEEQSIHQQKIMVEMMAAETKQKPRPINKRLYRSVEVEQAMAKEFIKRERTLEIMQQKKQTSAYKQPTAEDVDIMMIPQQVRLKSQKYKNTEMKYFQELIQDRRNDGGHMLNRRYPDKSKESQSTSSQLDKDIAKNKQPYPVNIEPYTSKKERLLKQYEEVTVPSLEDKQFKLKGSGDLQLTNKNPMIFLNEQEKKYAKHMDKTQSPHTKHLQRVKAQHKDLLAKGVQAQPSELMQMAKEDLMATKHFLEDKEKFNEYLQRKKKIQKMKKLQSQINKQKLSDRINYKQMDEIEGFDVSKHKDIFGIPDKEKIDAINQKYARSLFGNGKEDIDHMYHRTIRNMENWISYQTTANNTISRTLHEIFIVKFQPNEALTVMNVMWRLRPRIEGDNRDYSRFFEEKRLEQIDKNDEKKVEFIKNSLSKISVLMSAKMCQQLRLRYGPDIRFVYHKESQDVKNTRQKLFQQMPQLIKQKVKQQAQKGKLPKTMKIKDLQLLIGELEESFKSRVNKMEDPQHPLIKQKDKSSKKQNDQRDNRTEDGRRKKYQRKSKSTPAQRFWEKL